MSEYVHPANMMVNRVRTQNSFSGSSGAMGLGDRGANQLVPTNTGNPYDFQNYIERWRQYTHLYEIAWEARKIVRIPVEDALRKEWLLENIPEDVAQGLTAKFKQLNILNILSRSLMLERLLGGCLTFFGIESNTDDVSTAYHPSSGRALRFMNAIPISRISRMVWETDPLKEHYMRPQKYIVNGNELHTSRCLVWDGEPLFDPYDYALTNFRANLAGFGPSKLAPIWDDIVRARGTRQAAYHMIETNNALIMAVKGLQDLSGTKPGKQQIELLKQIANNISTYRAAVIEKEKVEFSQHSASFGSVPELLMSFIQVLSAASDIPATRFLGQAPGGLNATGDSDLENYYNMIDAYQRNRIEPGLRRIYDIIGYEKYPSQWKQLREKLTIKFPPMWNLSELEEADVATKRLDNAFKAFEAGFMSEEKVIDELNAKGVFSVDLDETDIDLTKGFDPDPMDGDIPPDNNGGQPPPQPKKQFVVPGAIEGEGEKEAPVKSDSTPVQEGSKETQEKVKNAMGFSRIPVSIAQQILADIGKEGSISPEALARGMDVEFEHEDITHGDLLKTALIAITHLEERPDYYERLAEMVENSVDWHSVDKNPTPRRRSAGNYKKAHMRMHGLDIAIENPKGSERSGEDAEGNKWSSILPADYGYIKRTEGADGDHVDVFIGPHESSEEIYVVDQKNLNTGNFDEHKVIFGALGMTQAKQMYLDSFSDGKGPDRLICIAPLTVDEFKQWLKEGDTLSPFANRKRKRRDI